MSLSYSKLFSSLPESTIWTEPLHVRVVWITLLATCDREGRIWASVPGLAKRSNVTLEQAQEALGRFMAPDRYSRTPDHEGRRIEPIDGGWRLLNHAKYRELLSASDRKEQKLRWWHDNRGRNARANGAVPQADPQPAAQSLENAAQAIEESRRATESASPMPEHVRAAIKRPKPGNDKGAGESPQAPVPRPPA